MTQSVAGLFGSAERPETGTETEKRRLIGTERDGCHTDKGKGKDASTAMKASSPWQTGAEHLYVCTKSYMGTAEILYRLPALVARSGRVDASCLCLIQLLHPSPQPAY